MQKPKLPVSRQSKRQMAGKTGLLLKGSAPGQGVSNLVRAIGANFRQKTAVTLKGCNRAVEESLAVGPADSNPCSPSPAEVRHAVLVVIQPHTCR